MEVLSTTVWPAHNAYDNFMKNCGTSALVVYAPESLFIRQENHLNNKNKKLSIWCNPSGSFFSNSGILGVKILEY